VARDSYIYSQKKTDATQANEQQKFSTPVPPANRMRELR
jgi:hypothetical protein